MRSRVPIALLLFVVASIAMPVDASDNRSVVYINGRRSIVHFSDGDSFRVYSGEWSGRGTRLGGFNTLESFGPVHSWGDWHPFELFIIAKKATKNAAQGVWHCTTEGDVDGYGRLLLDCPDLAVSQISQGLAHAMNVDDTPSRPAYLRAQQEAIRERRGMWAHGVPEFVLTSLHSRDEDPTRDSHYNRMVSVRDGHSERWEHMDTYPECSTQCAMEIRADADRVRAFARSLRERPDTRNAVAALDNLLLVELVDRYARLGQLPEYTEPATATVVEPILAEARSSGQLGSTQRVRGACHLYAAFTRRYGRERAACLHGRGAWPPHMQRGEE